MKKERYWWDRTFETLTEWYDATSEFVENLGSEVIELFEQIAHRFAQVGNGLSDVFENPLPDDFENPLREVTELAFRIVRRVFQ